MIVDVVTHPRELLPEHLADRIVLVFDVLRATTTMTAALCAGAKEIQTFDSLEFAESAASAFAGPKLLCGERHTLPPPGFDLGNSPGDYTPDRVRGKTIFFATTNGTRAIHAALNNASARPFAVYTAALVNASAAAKAALLTNHDVTLLCSGSDGKFSAEDFYGCGAVVDSMKKLTDVSPGSDATIAAHNAFLYVSSDLQAALRQTYGGHNNLRVGLGKDIDFAASLNKFDRVGVLSGHARNGHAAADQRVIRSTSVDPATIAIFAMPRNNPVSTTPARLSKARSNSRGLSIDVNRQS